MKLTSKQKRFNYQIKFYKNNNVVQEIQISKVNKVTIDKEEFMIGKEKENELDSLKNHLLLVAKQCKGSFGVPSFSLAWETRRND